MINSFLPKKPPRVLACPLNQQEYTILIDKTVNPQNFQQHHRAHIAIKPHNGETKARLPLSYTGSSFRR